MKIYPCLIMIIVCCSCTKKETEVISKSFDQGQLSDTLKMTLTQHKDEYRYSGQSEDLYLITFNESPTSLTFWDVPCSLITTQIIPVNDSSIEVHKFFYDAPNSVDEEAYLYFTKKHGLVALRGQFWNGHIFFENDNAALIKALESDNTDFFRSSRAY